MWRYLLISWCLYCLPAQAVYIYKKPISQVRVAIIIDDIGYNIVQGRRAALIDADITLAVLPHTPGSKQLAELGFQQGKEILLHAPMSNVHHKKLGPGALTSTMEQQQFIRVLNDNLDSIPHVSGVNNHMGSALTTQTQPMQWLMQTLKERQLFFIDSLTHNQSVALVEARKLALASAKRDVFLDNVQEEMAIKKALFQAVALARKQGWAIAIGHPYEQTMNVLELELPLLAQQDVEFVHVSKVLSNNQ